jgi:hypothetical protein
MKDKTRKHTVSSIRALFSYKTVTIRSTLLCRTHKIDILRRKHITESENKVLWKKDRLEVWSKFITQKRTTWLTELRSRSTIWVVTPVIRWDEKVDGMEKKE